MEIEFKRITTYENMARLTELMYLCFNIKVDEDFFKWKYFDNPAGQAIVYEAIYDGKTVGSYGVIPEFYWIDGVVKKTYQAVEAMTHADFQRKGLFVKLAQLVTQDALNENKELFMTAFPGFQSYGGFVNKLDWKLIHTVNYIFLPRIVSAFKNYNKPKSNFDIVKLDKGNKLLFNYLEGIRPHAAVSKVINKEIFSWKIFDNPRFKYNVIGLVRNNELLGICVYLVDYKNTCVVNWLNFNDKVDYNAYASYLLQYIFKETKIKYIYTMDSKSGFLSEAYRKAGFLTNPFNKGPFHSKIPFVIYQHGFDKGSSIESFNGYDFQPIILD
jgi:hypothetical protein